MTEKILLLEKTKIKKNYKMFDDREKFLIRKNLFSRKKGVSGTFNVLFLRSYLINPVNI